MTSERHSHSHLPLKYEIDMTYYKTMNSDPTLRSMSNNGIAFIDIDGEGTWDYVDRIFPFTFAFEI